MAFWIAAGFICLVVAALVVLAARRPPSDEAPAAAYDLKVYRDQLRELERDVARGTLSEAEATRARTEVSRRILDADRALTEGTARTGPSPAGTALIAGAVALTVAGAIWVYTQIGAPGYPDLPLMERVAAIEEMRENRPSQDLAEEQAADRPAPPVDPERLAMVEQLRTVMERRPDDTTGLELLAANEAMLGNFRAARLAQERLIALLGSEATGRHHIDHAEMMILAAGGYVSPEAEAALRVGLEREPRDGTGRFYAGEMYAQQGRPDRALPIWLSLLQDSRPDAPWVPPIRAQIADIAFAAGVEIDPALLDGPRGPSAAEMEAMDGLSADQQQAMIESMVEGLANRLATDGGTPEDWAQLITAYGVLGRSNAAQIVHDDAQVVFADFPDALEMIDAAFRAAMAQAGSQ
ncbi:c-type cytochrome biogenesis protein CcmI [Hasllibacter sp. MH4015]|uniref:c-type cytochrome biogenesis protein CcmI n=1 Tax=Hasllibacter sp. MH4015 TaxID=2854029 RepID=UPI001CD3AF3E|nr:c-type cytochrome biogenesis protein CcmI [Hasllibacter sp. MH4015]